MERRGVHGTAVAAAVAAAVDGNVAAVAAVERVAQPRVAVEDVPLPDHLQLPRPVALVHRTELVPPAAHSVVSHGCKGKKEGRREVSITVD